MSDTSKQSLVRFSKSLWDRQRYLAGVSKRYSSAELDASPADTVKSIAEEFEALLAVILCDTQFVSADPYIVRLMKKETQRREFYGCVEKPSVMQMSLF